MTRLKTQLGHGQLLVQMGNTIIMVTLIGITISMISSNQHGIIT